jgi:uncharacterized protein YmfQ (DUF2313 family)
MGVKVQAPERYEASLRKLFPRGVYWDRQFADTESDCSLFCKAKLDTLVCFRNRMSDLQDESMIRSALETLDGWERVLTGSVSAGLSAEQRRMLLITAKAGSVTIPAIKETGQMYGITVSNITFPFRPAFFGFSRFGLDPIAGPASFSVLFIYTAARPSGAVREVFEEQLTRRLLANYTVYFVYGGT